MRNTQTKRRETIASGGGSKSELDMLSKQFPVTLTSDRKDCFSYNIGRGVNDNKRSVPSVIKTPSDNKSGTQSMHKTATEMHGVPALADDTKASKSSLLKDSITETSRKTNGVTTTKHVSNKTVIASKTRNSVFESNAALPRKSLTPHVRKEDNKFTKVGKEDRRTDRIDDVCDKLSEKQHFSHITDSKLSGSNENMHLKPPASESEKHLESSPTNSRKSSLSRRSMISMASSNTSTNSLFDKILESRATMSTGSSESLQDLPSRRFSFQAESINSYSHDKRDSKSDSGSLVIDDSEQMEKMSPERKHAPDVAHISGENEKPIIKRTKTRRILET